MLIFSYRSKGCHSDPTMDTTIGAVLPELITDVIPLKVGNKLGKWEEKPVSATVIIKITLGRMYSDMTVKLVSIASMQPDCLVCRRPTVFHLPRTEQVS